jgi:thiosulfate dehydrogenase [quinone] large subunit
MTTQAVVTRKGETIQTPPFIETIFNDKRMAIIWLPLRVWIGIQWIIAGYEKLNPAWLQTGAALKGFWTGALANATGPHPAIAYDWYVNFLTALLNSGSYVWFAKLVVFGELTIGVLLTLGAFTGLAAFGGAFMNWNYMMAGSAGVNPMYLAIEIALLLAWKVAGLIGADYFVFKFGATPWKTQAVEVEKK